MRIQRSGLPLMILAGVVLVAAAGAVWYIANPFDRDRPAARTDDRPAVDLPRTPAAEPAPVTPEPAPIPAEPRADPAASVAGQVLIPASTITVRTGDTLFDIAGRVWSDSFLWPLLLQANDERLADPDYLRPGQSIAVPAWVTVESGLTEDRRRELSSAHVLAYRHYRSLGSDAIGLGIGQPAWWLARLGRTRMNKALWVLYSGLRYDEQLLDRFSGQIHHDDARQVRGFVNQFGLPPFRR